MLTSRILGCNNLATGEVHQWVIRVKSAYDNHRAYAKKLTHRKEDTIKRIHINVESFGLFDVSQGNCDLLLHL